MEASESQLQRSAALPGVGRGLRFWVALAIALAFADASIAVLALPQIVDRLHTTISHVVWVIAAYNAALIAGSLAIMFLAGRLRFRQELVVGLVVFGLASIGSGVAGSLKLLVAFRVIQGLGGAMLLCGSLPPLMAVARRGESPLAVWAGAAAIGAAVGPAAGGLLTELFDWRAIFLAQAPVAAIGAVAVWSAHRAAAGQAGGELGAAAATAADPRAADLDPASANVALALVSAGLIGALFLVTVLLINVFLMTPLAAAVVLIVIPLSTAVTERLTRGRAPALLGVLGSVALAAGLLLLAFVSHRHLAPIIFALVLCGAGLGLTYPPLSHSALAGAAHPLVRVARTIAARDGGLIVGLLVLTPILVNQLNVAPKKATAPVTKAVFGASMPTSTKLQLGFGLLAAVKNSSQAQLPDVRPAFANVSRHSPPPVRATLASLEKYVRSEVESAAARAFRKPLLYCALFAVLAVPVLVLRLLRRRSQGAGAVARA